MLKLTVLGNLGSDAEVRNENGHQFVSLSIAHTDRRTSADGQTVETTTWVSATINGDGGKLLPYLKKGTKVCAYGDAAVRTYHSEKQRALVAGIKLFVRDIELVSVNTDTVPRSLYNKDGAIVETQKYFHVNNPAGELYDRQGSVYQVDENGWVTPMSATPTANEQQTVEDGKVF